jgi:hypothetical protein
VGQEKAREANPWHGNIMRREISDEATSILGRAGLEPKKKNKKYV